MTTSAPLTGIVREDGRLQGHSASEARLVIGKVTIVAGTEFTTTYETASWYKTVVLDEEVTVDLVTNGYYAWPVGPIMGRVTASYFPSSFGGLSYGDRDRSDELDKPERIQSPQPYLYDLAKMWLESDGRECTSRDGAIRWQLDPAFHAGEVDYSYDVDMSRYGRGVEHVEGFTTAIFQTQEVAA